MKTKINNIQVEGYAVFNIARGKGKIKCTWDVFYEKYNKYKDMFKEITLCFLEDDYIFVERDDIRFLNKNKSKGYVVHNNYYRVRIHFRDKYISKYFHCEEDAIEFYREMRVMFIKQIADELSEIYDKEIIDKFLNKYL